MDFKQKQCLQQKTDLSIAESVDVYISEIGDSSFCYITTLSPNYVDEKMFSLTINIGCLVGIVGNHGEMTEPAADKGSHFVLMCNERDIPIIFLQNTSEKSTECDIQQSENIGNKLRAHSKMISAVSCSSVPKITFIVGNGIGPVNYFMGGRAVSPNFLFSWPNAVVGLTDMDTITDSICQMKMQSGTMTNDEKSSLEEQVKKKCQTEMSAFHAASRIWNDGIILPQNTRQVIGQCLDIVFAYRGKPVTTTPVIRM